MVARSVVQVTLAAVLAILYGMCLINGAGAGAVLNSAGEGTATMKVSRKFGAEDLVEAQGYTLHRNIMVPLRDGIRLATDLYLPSGYNGERLHTLLVRTPYDKSAKQPERYARVFVAREGYALAIQDVRGRYRSEGTFTKYLNEAADGHDVMAWVQKQAWSNGQIGTFGTSYLAHVQMAAACTVPPALKCMWLDEGGFSSAYHSGIRQGGTFELKQATWAFAKARQSVANDPEKKAAMDKIDIFDFFSPTMMPWKEGSSPLALAPSYEAYLLEQWRHGTFDEYWQSTGIYAKKCYADVARVPAMMMSGFYDPYSLTTTDNFNGLMLAARAKDRPTKYRMVLGPWMHGEATHDSTSSGDVSFGDSARLSGNLADDIYEMMVSHFNECLRGEGSKYSWRAPSADGVATPDTPSAQPLRVPDAPVRVFVMGGGTGRKTKDGKLDHGGAWVTSQAWPLDGTGYVDFYMYPNRSLHIESPAEAMGDSITYRYDPNDPVPSIGGTITSGAPVMEGGAFDQVERARFFPAEDTGRPLAERADVVAFRTGVLAEDLTVAGGLEVVMKVRSSCKDTDFTAKLVDEYPPSEDYPGGFAMNVADGILRARYRDEKWAEPKLMTPHEETEVVVKMMPVANKFKAGHRLRVDISSSNYPHFDINPNTGAPEGRGREKVVAENSIVIGDSRVRIPVVRYGV